MTKIKVTLHPFLGRMSMDGWGVERVGEKKKTSRLEYMQRGSHSHSNSLRFSDTHIAHTYTHNPTHTTHTRGGTDTAPGGSIEKKKEEKEEEDENRWVGDASDRYFITTTRLSVLSEQPSSMNKLQRRQLLAFLSSRPSPGRSVPQAVPNPHALCISCNTEHG